MGMWQIPHVISSVEFHMGNSTCEISHMKFHMWCFSCEISHVTYHMSYFTCEKSYVKFHMWNFTWGKSHGKFHMGIFTCDFFTWEKSHGKISHVIFHTWLFHMWNFTCEISHVKIHVKHIYFHMGSSNNTCETGIFTGDSHQFHMCFTCIFTRASQAALICCGAFQRTESNKLLSELGWPSLMTRRSDAKLCLMFKILNNMTPSYLLDDLVESHGGGPIVSARTNQLLVPRTSKFKNSFFPSTTSFWNKLPLIVKQSVSLNCFKSTLKRQHSAADSILPGVYNCFYGYHGSILAQLRFGLSNLKGDLFNFNLTDNPICPLCLGSFESRSHFFVNCTVLDVERRVLFGQISQFFPQFQQLSLIDKSIICTFGSPNLDFTTNFELLKCSVDYIRSSERFTPRYLTN